MDKQSLRIIFMGTPDFAVASLRALVENNYNVVAVITMPDKPVGRHGSVLQPSAIKQYALSVGLPVLQPERLKDETFIETLRSYHADLQIVVAFRMLPEVVWAMPPCGTFNLHASLLPRYRGAAPINWAIINGDTETGVTTFFLQHEIDTGEIIHQQTLPIGPDDDAETIHDQLMSMGSQLVLQTVDDIIAGTVRSVPQQIPADAALLPAPKLFRENTVIDWNTPAASIRNFIRGLSPYPSAWTTLVPPEGDPIQVKLFASHLESTTDNAAPLQPGQIDTDNRTYIKIGTREGNLCIDSLQLAGKKRLTTADFLRGNHLPLTDCHMG